MLAENTSNVSTRKTLPETNLFYPRLTSIPPKNINYKCRNGATVILRKGDYYIGWKLALCSVIFILQHICTSVIWDTLVSFADNQYRLYCLRPGPAIWGHAVCAVSSLGLDGILWCRLHSSSCVEDSMKTVFSSIALQVVIGRPIKDVGYVCTPARFRSFWQNELILNKLILVWIIKTGLKSNKNYKPTDLK